MELVSAYLTCLQKKSPTSKREDAFAPVKMKIELVQAYLDKRIELFMYIKTKEYIQQLKKEHYLMGSFIEFDHYSDVLKEK